MLTHGEVTWLFLAAWPYIQSENKKIQKYLIKMKSFNDNVK